MTDTGVMKIVVRADTGRGARVAGAPAALGAFGVCAAKIGVVGTTVVMALTVAALVGIVRVHTARYRRRSRAPGVILRAETSWEEKPGALSISKDYVAFSAKSGEVTRLAKVDLALADLADVRSLIRLTRATLSTEAGDVFHLTITAPADDVAKALSA